MSTVRIRHVRNSVALQALLSSPDGGVAKDLFRRGVKVQNQAKRNLERSPRRIDTGTLRSDIHVELITFAGKPAVRIGFNVFYGLYVHDGTGVYGPKGVPITPKSAKFLRWKSKKGKWMFARQVLGMRPNPFLKDAVDAAKD